MKVSSGWARVVGGCGALALASMLAGCLPAGGNGSSSSSSCDSDEVRARPSGLPRACYSICETQADCSGATTCTEVNGGNDLACLPEASASNNPTNNTTTGCVSDAECSGATPVCASGVCVSEGDPCALIDCEVGSTCRAGQCVDDTIEPECTSDGQCASGEVCQAGECVVDGGDECDFNSDCPDIEICQDGSCVRDPDVECVGDRDCVGDEICLDGECVVEEDPIAELCETFCGNVYGSCPKSTCGGLTARERSDADTNYDLCVNGGVGNGQSNDPCRDRYAQGGDFQRQVDDLAALSCGGQELRDIHCYGLGYGDRCGCTGWNVGARCTSNSDCDTGQLSPTCLPQNDPNTGEATGWVGGYCLAGGCDAGNDQAGQVSLGPATGCGLEAICVNEQGEQGVSALCFDLCTRTSDCRSGYDCQELGTFADGTTAGRCIPPNPD